MRHRDVMKYGFDVFNHFIEEYRLATKGNYRKDLILKFIEYQLVIMYPITPHMCEMEWFNTFRPLKENSHLADILSRHSWPIEEMKNIDYGVLDSYDYIEKLKKDIRQKLK